MKQAVFIIFLVALSGCAGHTDERLGIANDEELARQIVESGYVHRPLPLDRSRSIEERDLQKTVLEELPIKTSVVDWTSSGIGELSLAPDCEAVMTFPTTTGIRAKGASDDPDYATYGSFEARCNLGGKDLSAYNRIVFRLFPDCPGQNVINLNFIVPGYAGHLVNLIDGQWNECCFDIQDIDRTQLKHIGFVATIRGSDCGTDTLSRIKIDGIKFQRIAQPKKTYGWEPLPSAILYPSSGYMADSPKTAIADISNLPEGERFHLIDSRNGKTMFTGYVKRVDSSIGTFAVIDFSKYKREGLYYIEAGPLTTPEFLISNSLWTDSEWKALNFIFCQRCGYEVPGVHSKCHEDLVSVHKGDTISFDGGWHDAGDLSQQTLQTADVAFCLLEASVAASGINPALSDRLKEEALWGLDFCLKNRYKDGYRASSMGLLIWQDGKNGSFDDISSVRVQNNAFDNFLHSGYEAYAASVIDDPSYRSKLEEAAREDFRFASEKFARDGFDTFTQPYEHTYCTSRSQYMATLSWAASMLFSLTGEETYADAAAEAMQYTLECQETQALDNGMRGFFYRDTNRLSIVHYIHQSREQFYMMALDALMETQPGHKDFEKWKNSMILYSDYLKSLMDYVYPYEMMPSGLYMEGEYNDTEGFRALHLFAPQDAGERYDAQLHNGVKVDSCHYVKRFPIWFNIFNGNSAVLLSTAKAAAVCGKALSDERLIDIAREQLYWITGKNPFGESLMYGEGWNYPSMDSFSSGEMTGEMPVGICSMGEEDVPCWPQVNNACYKEVWTTVAGKWLSLVAELL